MIMRNDKRKIKIIEICVFSMLGALMFCSKIVMEILPNIHLLGMFVMTFTIVFRAKALIPIYIYVFLNGLYAGFNLWWIPYLYIWTVLWAITMLLPKKMPRWLAALVYPAVCGMHGVLFGILYAPAEAILFHLNFEQMLAWIASGVLFDAIHAVSNVFMGMLVLPLSQLITRLSKQIGLINQ